MTTSMSSAFVSRHEFGDFAATDQRGRVKPLAPNQLLIDRVGPGGVGEESKFVEAGLGFGYRALALGNRDQEGSLFNDFEIGDCCGEASAASSRSGLLCHWCHESRSCRSVDLWHVTLLCCDRPGRANNAKDSWAAARMQKARDVWTIGPDAIVYDALRMLADKNVGALVVVDGGKVCGIVSERDYARKIVLEGRDSRESSVADIMTADVKTITRDRTVSECMTTITEHAHPASACSRGWRVGRADLCRRHRQGCHRRAGIPDSATRAIHHRLRVAVQAPRSAMTASS